VAPGVGGFEAFAYSSVALYYSDSPTGERVPLPEVADLLVWYRTRDLDHQSIP